MKEEPETAPASRRIASLLGLVFLAACTQPPPPVPPPAPEPPSASEAPSTAAPETSSASKTPSTAAPETSSASKTPSTAAPETSSAGGPETSAREARPDEQRAARPDGSAAADPRSPEARRSSTESAAGANDARARREFPSPPAPGGAPAMPEGVASPERRARGESLPPASAPGRDPATFGKRAGSGVPPPGGGFAVPGGGGAAGTPNERIRALDAELGRSLIRFDERLAREKAALDEESAGAAREAVERERDRAASGEAGSFGFRPPPAAGGGEDPEPAPGLARGFDPVGGDQIDLPHEPPGDVGDGEDDDIVARQLREAAEKESDPRLRERLWDEYREYKRNSG